MTVAGEINGFKKWINEPGMGDDTDVWVAAFDNNGLALSEGFHTLTTTDLLSGSYYNAFVYGHGPDGMDTSYGYLAGYDRKLNLAR